MRRLDDPLADVGAPRAEGWIERDCGHRIYWSDAGNPDGLPVVMCHGGPGGASSAAHRRICDGALYRIVQFDQRGCGRSEPAGRLEHTSLQHTLGDMEALRESLGIARWVAAGGSWGSTVALAYAQAHPDRCVALMLVSTWLLRRADVDWWFHGVARVFPELWQQFAAGVPASERGDLRRAYCRTILGGDADAAQQAATQLFQYEEGFMHFEAPFVPADPARGPRYGRIFAHYADHDFFLEEGQLLRDAHRVAHLPAVLLTGRYDMCTTPDNAFALAERLPLADLRIVPGAGHYPTEPALARACITAARDLHRRVTTCAE
ncbi:MAG: alpha/beta fold hydrolase [Steroidobacteraceae bacterium]